MSQSKLMSFFSSATENRKRDSDDSDESQPGPSTMRNGSETVNTVLQELGNNDGSEVKYKDITIKHNQNLTRQFESVRGSFLDKLIDNLETRFPENELHILECFDKVFNPKRYPDNSLLAYGRDQLNTLCDHYSILQ